MIELVATAALCGLTFLAAHKVGDHVLQTDFQAANKVGQGKESWKALLGHIFSYHVLQVIMLLAVIAIFDLPVTLLGFTVAVLFSAVSHTLIDRRWPIRKLLQFTGSPKFAELVTPINGMYVADQSSHEWCLWICTLIIVLL